MQPAVPTILGMMRFGVDSYEILSLQRAMERGLVHHVHGRWQSDTRLDLDDHRVAQSLVDADGRRRVLLELPEGLASVSVTEDEVYCHAAGAEPRLARSSLEVIRGLLPPRTERRGITLRRWLQTADRGARSIEGEFEPEPWSGGASNYDAATRRGLDALAALRRAPSRGRFVVFHGPPGTGKTHAARALATEWCEWAGLEVILDPDRLLADPGYLLEVARRGERERQTRVLLLEDCGELLRRDAISARGQAASRLLNLTDGFLAELADVLVILTTNEPVGELHPALTRAGRCAAAIEFHPLDGHDLVAWRGAHGLGDAATPGPTTLAELYAEAEGTSPAAPPSRSVGFA